MPVAWTSPSSVLMINGLSDLATMRYSSPFSSCSSRRFSTVNFAPERAITTVPSESSVRLIPSASTFCTSNLTSLSVRCESAIGPLLLWFPSPPSIIKAPRPAINASAAAIARAGGQTADRVVAPGASDCATFFWPKRAGLGFSTTVLFSDAAIDIGSAPTFESVCWIGCG